jgi:hypothetical protein
MNVTAADIAEYESEGYEVRQQEQANGDTLHILYKDGQPAGMCLDWLPEHHSIAGRQARKDADTAMYARAAERNAALRAEREAAIAANRRSREAESGREAGA